MKRPVCLPQIVYCSELSPGKCTIWQRNGDPSRIRDRKKANMSIFSASNFWRKTSSKHQEQYARISLPCLDCLHLSLSLWICLDSIGFLHAVTPCPHVAVICPSPCNVERRMVSQVTELCPLDRCLQSCTGRGLEPNAIQVRRLRDVQNMEGLCVGIYMYI